ncbi:MAG TPA: hypothetical protein VFI06_02650 [Chitinophagaceae bacterium]|nr:hypothetical protein [Chitinophagaceae bacterium]
MTDSINKHERIKNRLEILSTVVLSFATLAIAWCSYQSSLWNGIQTINLIEANTYDMLALEKTTIMEQQQEIDVTTALNFTNAVVDRNRARVDFYLQHGRPEMSKIYSDWLRTDPLNNPNAPDHPLAMKEYKDLSAKLRNEQSELKRRAVEYKDRGLRANLHSDNYVLYTVIFGMVLFINGISSKITNVRLMRLFLLASATICLISLITLLTQQPITAPG